nr:hypothetical protein [Tanacetum cinerariifolium]
MRLTQLVLLPYRKQIWQLIMITVEVVDMTVDEDVDEVIVAVVVKLGFGKGNYYGVSHCVLKWQDKGMNENDGDEKEKGITANSCYRCGSVGHLAKHCRTTKHLFALYQKYIKNRENGMESNFVYCDRDDILDDPKDQTCNAPLRKEDVMS